MTTRHHTVSVDGVDVFYREAGPKDGPTILLLHGFPSSSHMFRDLITQLDDRFHVIAPDYIGFGYSARPAATARPAAAARHGPRPRASRRHRSAGS